MMIPVTDCRKTGKAFLSMARNQNHDANYHRQT
jgi:hypothetical protein